MRVVVQEPYIGLLRPSNMNFIRKLFHECDYEELDSSTVILKILVPENNVLRCTKVRFSLKRCTVCNKTIEELRQEITYPEYPQISPTIPKKRK